MPELPEVETIKNQLAKSIVGKKIRDIQVFTDKMVHIGSGKISNIKKGSPERSKKFNVLLAGKSVVNVERRAKYLVIRLTGDYSVLIHLRMSGQLIFVPKEDLQKPIKLSMAKTALEQVLPIKHTHAAFVFTDKSVLYYNDTRQFGHLRLVSKSEFSEVVNAAKLGPEPLDISVQEFSGLVKKFENKRAKDFLLNQSVIAGVGNIYADESLFISKVRPDRKMQNLSNDEIKKYFCR